MELVIIVVLSLVLVPLVLLTSGALRIALGLVFVLFFPGYTLIAALFPKKGSLDGMERLALSLGLSIAVVSLIGLILNYTPWGIRLYPILISLLLLIIGMTAIAWYRRQRLPTAERFDLQLHYHLSGLSRSWVLQSRRDRALTALLLIAVAGAIGTLVYAITTPKVGERFTEFYVLGLEGKAQNYPREVTLGDKGRVILRIVNWERKTAVYEIKVTIGGEEVTQIGPITLDQEEKWEQEVGFSPTRAGSKQKVEFLLYKGVSTELYRTLHFWIDVKEIT